MIDRITPEDKARAKANLESWLEIQDRKKELKAENDGIVSDTAQLLDVKKPIVNKLFTALKKKMDGEENPSDEVDTIIETVFRN